jgi:predicted dehydrogenase
VLPALQRSPTADLVAVASRDAERARIEAANFGAQRDYGSYAALLDDPDVEAVYIPLPNALHAEWAIEAMEAGLHVHSVRSRSRRRPQKRSAWPRPRRPATLR